MTHSKFVLPNSSAHLPLALLQPVYTGACPKSIPALPLSIRRGGCAGQERWGEKVRNIKDMRNRTDMQRKEKIASGCLFLLVLPIPPLFTLPKQEGQERKGKEHEKRGLTAKRKAVPYSLIYLFIFISAVKVDSTSFSRQN